MKKFISIFFVLFICSCSNLSKNIVEDGNFYLNNGTFADKKWNESLRFDRYSWYHEMTLQFDLMITSIPPQSGFNFWFSKDELAELNSCQESRVIFIYSLDTKVISYNNLYDQFEKYGFKKVELFEFKKQLRQHPDANMNALKLYNVMGLCRKKSNTNQIVINFPGYSEKLLK